MFIWRSKALEQYSDGWVIIDHTDITEARKIARLALEDYINDVWAYLANDEEEKETIQGVRNQFEQDISVHPLTKTALLIPGSQ